MGDPLEPVFGVPELTTPETWVKELLDIEEDIKEEVQELVWFVQLVTIANTFPPAVANAVILPGMGIWTCCQLAPLVWVAYKLGPKAHPLSTFANRIWLIPTEEPKADDLDKKGAGGEGICCQEAPLLVVVTIEAQAVVLQLLVVPKTNPSDWETKVTELGSNPLGAGSRLRVVPVLGVTVVVVDDGVVVDEEGGDEVVVELVVFEDLLVLGELEEVLGEEELPQLLRVIIPAITTA